MLSAVGTFDPDQDDDRGYHPEIEAIGGRITLFVGPVLPVPARDDVCAALVCADVVVRSAARSSLRLTFQFDGPHEDWSEPLAQGYFDPGIRLVLLALLPTHVVLFDGLVTGQELVVSDAAATLVVLAEDLSLLMDLLPTVLQPPALAPDKRALTIIGRYAAQGITPLVVPPPLVDVPNPTDPVPATAATDYVHLQTLAQHVGHVFRIQPGPGIGESIAYWGPEIQDSTAPARIAVGRDARDAREVGIRLDGLVRREIAVTIVSPSGVSIPVPVPDVGIVRPHLAARPAPKLRHETLAGTAPLSPVQATLAGLAAALATEDAVRVEGALDTDSYGQVLLAGAVVELDGTGVAYDGRYYVAQVTHRITSDGHEQDFVLRREGLGAPPP